MEEKVDILLTSYNTNIQFLKEQIDSILNQTYKNFNLLISDDNSIDKELIKTLKEYEQKDKRIQLYLNNENKGFLKNFEYLLNKSTENYIMFSDHDDIWHKDKIEKSLKKIIESDVSLVYSDATQIDEKGEILHNSYLKYKNMPFLRGKDDINFFTRHTVIGCSQIFTKQVKEKMLPFKTCVTAHDWISIYIASKEKGVDYIEEPLLDYRLHSANVFGGRSFKQNIKKWKAQNSKNYSSYLKYRKNVIKDAYLNGCKMCYEYSEQYEKIEEEKVIKYYEKLLKSKFVNFRIDKYFKYLYFKGTGIRAIKELIIFHFPILGYLIYTIS